MNVKVKICGVTCVSDGLAAAAAGADMIGLMFYERSSRHVPFVTAAEIALGVAAARRQSRGICQSDGGGGGARDARVWLDPAAISRRRAARILTQFGVMSLKAFRVRDAASLAALPEYRTDAWLLDAFSPAALGGTGERFNWELAVDAKKLGRPIFLAGGLTPENVAEAVRRVQPFAVDVSSGVESAPGKKDPAKVRAFIAAAKGVAVTET